jgi:tungstate transport system ATP-binding protein
MGMSGIAAFHLRNLHVEYGGRTVLDLADLEIPPASVTAIVGPNGAGKTTLLRTLALLQRPTSGTLQLYGVPVAHREPERAQLRRDITLVAQSPLLFRRSVYANVAYGLRLRRTAAAQRVDAALATVGLAGFARRPAWKLSGGETQRVAIARALAIDPSVYLFDEPTANVDRQHVLTVESVLLNLGAAGKTVIMTTHNLEQAYRLSDTLISLSEGRLAPFPLVNVLRGTTASLDGHCYFLTEGLRLEMPDTTTARHIAIDPDSIIVAREPLHSSARNCFAGRIVKVEHEAHGVVVTADCGRPLVARITRHSYTELALNVGMPVYIIFKSSAIHVLDSESTPSRELKAES